MSSVFAVDACRTPVGKIKGSLAGARPDHLTADVIQALVARNPWLDPARIDDVYWGAANQAGEDNRNVARMGVLLAGLPVEIPGATVNRLCGSGMEAIAGAARAIAAGDADICLAGGTESMTRAPFVLPRSADPFPRDAGVADTRLGWRLVSQRMQEMYPPITLGETAENVAERYGVDRERQDRFALRSHQRAGRAAAAGVLAEEIIPVTVPGRKGASEQVTADEGIKPDLTLGDLAGRPAAFKPNGTVTGGNSSPLNDGAAGLLLMSERAVRAAGAEAIARYAGTAAAGVHPDYMGIGPVPAMTKLLARASGRWATSAWSRSTRRSRRRPSRSSTSSNSTRNWSTSTAARSPSAIRSAARAPGSPRRCCTSSAAGARAWPPPRCASASARASPRCGRPPSP